MKKPDKLQTDYRPGDIVPVSGGSYRIIRVLGAGGMADVYEIEDRNLGRKFVMKCLRSSAAREAGILERFEREARIIARLRHPNIVEVYRLDCTQDELQLPHYLMERLDGEVLREALARKGKFELQVALAILIDILSALDYTHEKEVIHRDLKPDNVFLHRASSGLTVAKLLDYGVAKMRLAKITLQGGFIGTCRYASPEQHRGRIVTAKCDIFSAGLVGCEMMTGQHPFASFGSGAQIARAIMQRDATPLPPHFPGEIVEIFAAALSRDPAKRPDAFEFLGILKRVHEKLIGGQDERSVHDRSTVEEVTHGAPSSEPARPMTLADVAAPTDPDAALPFANTTPTPLAAPTADPSPPRAPFAAKTIETPMIFDEAWNVGVSGEAAHPSARTPRDASIDRSAPTNLPKTRDVRAAVANSDVRPVRYVEDEEAHEQPDSPPNAQKPASVEEHAAEMPLSEVSAQPVAVPTLPTADGREKQQAPVRRRPHTGAWHSSVRGAALLGAITAIVLLGIAGLFRAASRKPAALPVSTPESPSVSAVLEPPIATPPSGPSATVPTALTAAPSASARPAKTSPAPRPAQPNPSPSKSLPRGFTSLPNDF